MDNPWMIPERSEPFAALADGTPLYQAYYPRRRGERYRRAMRWWDGATGEWVGTTPDGRLFRQRQLWGNARPRPDRWQEFALGCGAWSGTRWAGGRF